MRKSFRAYAAAGLAAATLAIVFAPVLTNLYIGERTLIYAVLLQLVFCAAAALWAAGSHERRMQLWSWLRCGLSAGALTSLAFALIAGLGYFIGVGFGARFGEAATLAIAFTAAALTSASAYGAHWLAWRYLAPKAPVNAA